MEGQLLSKLVFIHVSIYLHTKRECVCVLSFSNIGVQVHSNSEVGLFWIPNVVTGTVNGQDRKNMNLKKIHLGV